MDPLKLICPLGCAEIFTSLQSLKYHLLSICSNILCPSCGSRFLTILELITHLDNECGKATEENDDSNNETLNSSVLNKTILSPQIETKNDVKINANEEISIEEISGKISSANEYHEDNMRTYGDSFEECVVLEEDMRAEIQENTDPLHDSCNDGSSISKYIFDELAVISEEPEIITEEPEIITGEPEITSEEPEIIPEETEEPEIISEESAIIPEEPEIIYEELAIISEKPAIIYEDPAVEEAIVISNSETEENIGINGNQDNLQVSNRGRMPQFLNTIKEEDCIDKDGLPYTRKVVQIEKFWDENSTILRKPTVIKYIYNSDGTITRHNSNDEVPEGAIVMEIFQCTSCNVKFSNVEQFDSHKCNPVFRSKYKCLICDSSFTNMKSMNFHMKSHKKLNAEAIAPPNGPFLCNICYIHLPSNSALKQHQRIHNPSQTTESAISFEHDMTENEVRETFKCKVCGKSYDKIYEEIHMAYHSGLNQYNCYICNRKFFTHSNLEMHMRAHDSTQKYYCAICKEGFLTEDALKQHLNQSCNSRPHQCSYCSQRFARPYQKIKHERIHTGERPYMCEICGKAFRVIYCLTLHLQTHSGLRPYICQHCGKRFKQQSVYNHHLMTHSDVRNFKCPECPKAFKTSVLLAGHKKTHKKPFNCTKCNRPFANLHAVRFHMEAHKRKSNFGYHCCKCGAAYDRSFAIRNHIKEVHVDVPIDKIEEVIIASLMPRNYDNITLNIIKKEMASSILSNNNNTQNQNIALNTFEQGMVASTSILPNNDIQNRNIAFNVTQNGMKDSTSILPNNDDQKDRNILLHFIEEGIKPSTFILSDTDDAQEMGASTSILPNNNSITEMAIDMLENCSDMDEIVSKQ